MRTLKHLLESYLGIIPAEPGEGTSWQFLTQPLLPGSVPGWATAILVGVLIATVVWLYRKDAHALPTRVRLLLTTLRIALLGVLLLFLTQLTLSVERTGLPFVAVMVDTSASMGLDDARNDGQTRLAIARELLLADEARLLTELSRTHHLRLYEFAGSRRPLGSLGDASEGEPIDWSVPLNELTAEGNDTNLATSLSAVLDDFRGSPPSGVILLTDGVSSGGEGQRLSIAAEDARRRVVPLFPIGVGSADPPRDIQVYDVLHPDVAFVGDPLSFTFKVKAHGFAGRAITATLKQEQNAGQNDPPESIDQQTITTTDDQPTTTAELTVMPTEPGEYTFEITIPPQPGELNQQNNMVKLRVRVRKEKLRVLLIDSVPRWEFRHLKTLLERDSMVALSTVLQDADLEYTAQDRTAIARVPVSRDELFAFDVIILGDADLSYLNPATVQDLREFVNERGGGMIMIGGPRHNPLSYGDTPLEDLLPVEVDKLTLPDASQAATPIDPLLTSAGRSHMFLRLADDPASDARTWQELPPLYWLQRVDRWKRGAQVLLEHPTERGSQGPLPIILLQRFGAGQVLYHATDELWRWRRRVEDLHYGRYWSQAIRYLSRSRASDARQGVELATDRSVYRQGDPVSLTVTFSDTRLVPAAGGPLAITVDRDRSKLRSLSIPASDVTPNVFADRMTNLPTGTYQLRLDDINTGATAPSTTFLIESPDQELRNTALDRNDLLRSASLSRGKYYTPDEVDTLLDEFPKGEPVPLTAGEPIPLWNRWELLLLFCGLLASEWILRKRHRLV